MRLTSEDLSTAMAPVERARARLAAPAPAPVSVLALISASLLLAVAGSVAAGAVLFGPGAQRPAIGVAVAAPTSPPGR